MALEQNAFLFLNFGHNFANRVGRHHVDRKFDNDFQAQGFLRGVHFPGVDAPGSRGSRARGFRHPSKECCGHQTNTHISILLQWVSVTLNPLVSVTLNPLDSVTLNPLPLGLKRQIVTYWFVAYSCNCTMMSVCTQVCNKHGQATSSTTLYATCRRMKQVLYS